MAPHQPLLILGLLALAQIANAAPKTPLTVPQTILELKSQLRGCVLAQKDTGFGLPGFTELFMYYATDIYRTADEQDEAKWTKVHANIQAFNHCLRNQFLEVLRCSEAGSKTCAEGEKSDIQIENVHIGTVGQQLVAAVRKYGFIKATTQADADKELAKFSFGDKPDFYMIEITQFDAHFKLNVYATQSSDDFLSIMYAELMSNYCMAEYIRRTLTKSICDPIYMAMKQAALLAGFPMVSLMLSLMPSKKFTRAAHALTCATCLAKQAAAKLNTYKFVGKIKDKIDEIKALFAKTDKIESKPETVWDKISAVALKGWSDVRARIENSTMYDNFWANAYDTAEIIRGLSRIPGFEHYIPVFDLGLDMTTGIATAMKEKRIDTETTKLQAVLLKAKDLAVKAVRLKSKFCNTLWSTLVSLKDKAWGMTAQQLMDTNKDLATQLNDKDIEDTDA